MPRRLLIVDDHDVVRTGVKALIAATDKWEVCGEAANGTEAIKKAKLLAPDVVLLDVNMPGMSGFDAAVEIRQAAPEVKVIFFSMHEIPSVTRYTGVDGFVSKRTAVRDLVPMLESVVGSAPKHS